MPLKIIFAGTPNFAVPTLQKLLDSSHQVVAVYTQPDRPAGRGQQLKPSPVKQVALQYQLPIQQPQTLRNPLVQDLLQHYQADLMIVVAYGLILPKPVLAMFDKGCINVHASLLPRWRGAAPIQRAILAGDKVTGVTIMQMDVGLDTGPMLRRATLNIEASDTSASLHDHLAQLGANELLLTLDELELGKLMPEIQNNNDATYAAKIEKVEAEINWQDSAAMNARKIRAFNPWPIAFTHCLGETWRIWHANTISHHSHAAPGTIIHADKQGIQVTSGEGVLNIQELQLPGGRPISAADFLNAHRDKLIFNVTQLS